MTEFRFERRRRLEEEQNKTLYDREQKVLDMRATLEERGLTPDEANTAVSHWAKTGQWNLPTSHSVPGKMEPGPDGLIGYGPAQPVQKPVRLRKREDLEVPYQVDESGKIVEPEMGEGFMDQMDSEGYRMKPKFDVRKKPERGTGGYDILVDADGNEVNRYPNMSDKNTTRVLPRPAGGGKEDMDPQKKAAYKTLEEYDQMMAKGDINEEFEQRAVSAAKLVGLPIEKIVNKPGFFGRLIGKGDTSYERPSYTKGAPPPAPPATKQRATDFLKANGKPITPANIAAVIQRGLVK